MKRFKRDPIGWHVIARGARRLDLFRDSQDFQTFLAMLRFALLASGCTLWAMTLMSNHYHLVIHASTLQLTSCMRRLNRSYSRYHNLRYGLVGHAFDGPYKAFAQPTPVLLLRTIAYVFMNPVSAGLKQQPQDYAWTSVRDYLGLPGSPFKVNPTEVMRRVSADPSQAWAWFHRAMEREARRPKRVVPDRLTRTELQSQQFEWLLEHARESAGRLGGEDPILVAAYWAKLCGITPRAMAAILQDQTPMQLSQMLSDLGKALKRNPDRALRLALP